MLWELRIRTPKRIDDVVIETEGDHDEVEARRLADAYIGSLESPAVRFIYLRKFIVARSKDFPKAETDSTTDQPARSARRATEQPAGRIGA